MIDEFITQVFHGSSEDVAVIHDNIPVTFGEIQRDFELWCDRLSLIPTHSVVGYASSYSSFSISLTLACIVKEHVAVPLSASAFHNREFYVDTAEIEYLVDAEAGDALVPTGQQAKNPLHAELRSAKHSGLVLFSSGSTGVPKAILLNFDSLIDKFLVKRKTLRGLAFLMSDHIGGVNTLLYQLSNRGTLVSIKDHSPEAVCEAIERWQVELLPVSPSFLNLLLISGALDRHDVRSLKLVTYGTEVMPAWTLRVAAERLPNAEFQQTYGLSELGILRSKSKSRDSLFVKVGGDGFETKVVDDTLWIRAKSSMVGYLNAPSPFKADGWFDTGDRVEVDEEGYVRFLGRASEIINVGGEKVFPAEVESILLQITGVEDALVYGESHPLTGQIVVASIRMLEAISNAQARHNVQSFFKLNGVPSFMTPMKVTRTEESLTTERFKKSRRNVSG
jgi:long-chain acyl-CoA synthetase